MLSQSQCFPYEKNIVINALYDTIEALGLSLDKANSMRGILIVSNAMQMGKMRIELIFNANTKQTLVEICPENGDVSFAETWSPIIIDELKGNMMRIYPIEGSGK